MKSKIKIHHIDNQTMYNLKDYCCYNFLEYIDKGNNQLEILFTSSIKINNFLEKFSYLKNKFSIEPCLYNHGEIKTKYSKNKNVYNLNILKKMYDIPNQELNEPKIISIMTFGGGLFGEFSNTGKLLKGDCIDYWTTIGIPKENMPTVILKTIQIENQTYDLDNTIHNTLNVQTIGAICKSSNLVIVLYLFQNDILNLENNLQFVIKDKINLNGYSNYTNNILITWGVSESLIPENIMKRFNEQCKNANNLGINVFTSCCNNGPTDIDFPASSPYVIACGGSDFVNHDDNDKKEKYNENSGFGVSKYFKNQNINKNEYRSIPDLVCFSNPEYCMDILVNKTSYTVGGTSFSAAFYVSIFTLMNLNENLNELLYKIDKTSFNKIGSSNNYDSQTGLGSINVSRFLNNLKNKNKVNIYQTDEIAIDNKSTNLLNTKDFDNDKNNYINYENEVNIESLNNTKLNKNKSINHNDIKITNIIIPSVIHIVMGQIVLITPTIIPNNATNKNLSWVIENDNVIELDIENNSIIGKNQGTTQVKLCSKDGSNIEEKIIINVSSSDVKVKGISFESNVVNVIRGEKTVLTPIINPYNAINTNVIYKMGNLSIATINNEGIIRGINTGSTYVTANTVDGNFKATIKINVVNPIKNISITTTSKTIKVGKILKIGFDYKPKTSNPILNWSTTDDDIATISKSGLLTAISPGEVSVICQDIITGLSDVHKFNIIN